MLQSDQVDDHTLIAALVKKYYPRIYQDALSQLIYPGQAQRAAQDIFVQAIIQSKTFRGEISLSAWLDVIASRILKKRISLLQRQQLLNLKLIQSIKLRKSDPHAPLDLEMAIQGIKRGLHSRKSSDSKKITAQVLGLFGVISLVMLVMFASRNFLPQEEIGKATPADIGSADDLIPPETVARQQNTIPGSQPVSTAPLTLASTDLEIRERIRTSSQNWDTLWAEIVVTFHGPDGYMGPPKQERSQFWIDPQRGGMLVSGPMDGFPDFIERFTIPATMDNSLTSTWGEIFTQIGNQVPWFALNLETILNLPFVLNYLAESTVPDIIQFDRYLPVGEQFWAGYQALIVDLAFDTGFPAGRILLEPETGIILREQYYVPGSKKIFIESSIQDLKFNQPMPTMWKRPDYVQFSPRMFLPDNPTDKDQSSSWSSPEILPRLTGSIRPSNFDPSQAQLAFIKSKPLNGHDNGLEKYDIYGDNFLLGEIELLDPLQMICTRSPSGKRLAFAKWTYFPDRKSNKIYWFDLDEMQISDYQLPEIALHWIGFSPDNRTLGMSGFSEADGRYIFILMDTENGTSRRLPIVAIFNRIAWSSDGNRILVLEEIPPSFDSDAERIINVYSSENGQLLDQIKVKDGLSESNDLRILDGGVVEFIPGIQDISSCAAPPGD